MMFKPNLSMRLRMMLVARRYAGPSVVTRVCTVLAFSRLNISRFAKAGSIGVRSALPGGRTRRWAPPSQSLCGQRAVLCAASFVDNDDITAARRGEYRRDVGERGRG